MFDPSQITSHTLRQAMGILISVPSQAKVGESKEPSAVNKPPQTVSDPEDVLPSTSTSGAAQNSIDFLDQIVNPWAAPDLNEVLNGEVILKFREGDSVLEIQQRLMHLGYQLEPTSVLDQQTFEAIELLHETEGLPFSKGFDVLSLTALEQAETKLSQFQAEQDLAEAQLEVKFEAQENNKQEAYDTHQQEAIDSLKALKSKDLNALARRSRQAFFEALMPAALESERRYGVPAVVTLAQASLESAWAAKPIGGFNIFGIKGSGPGGSVNVETREVIKGKDIYIKDNFARFNNYYEAVSEHGKHYNNGKYDKALADFAQDGDAKRFVDTIAPTYATDPHYAWAIKKRFTDFNLLELVAKAKNPD